MCDDHGHEHHHDHGPTAYAWGRAGLVLGTAALVVPAVVAFVPGLPPLLTRLLAFSTGPLVALAAVSLGGFLRAGRDGVALRLSVAVTALAGALLGAASVLGALSRTLIDRAGMEVESDIEQEALGRAAWAVDTIVRAALGLTWEIWLAVGAVLLAVAVARHPMFGRVWAVAGAALAVATGALALAAWPFPVLPVGGFAPVLAVAAWYAAVLARTARAVWRMSRGYAGWPEPSLVA